MKRVVKKAKTDLKQSIIYSSLGISSFPTEVKKYIRTILKKNNKILKEIDNIFVDMNIKLDSIV